MARMFGFIANRVDDKGRVFRLHRQHLLVERHEDTPVGWGLGFYQYGEVLLRRRPVDPRPIIDLTELSDDISTDLLIAHVRLATSATLSTENTHPFRYRNWLFAQTGSVLGFEKLVSRLRESMPDFLLRNVRGETDSELFFHLVLSFLHDAGKLNREHPEAPDIKSALRGSVALVDQLSTEEGYGPNDGDVLMTDGELLVALHRSGVMAYRTLSGSQVMSEAQATGADEELVLQNPSTASFSLIGSDFAAVPLGWTPVPNGSLVTLARSGSVGIEPL